jgi:hypothetical protein
LRAHCLGVLDESLGSAAKSGGLDLDLEFVEATSKPDEGSLYGNVEEIEVSKLLRACGGCLGAERR